TAKRDPKDPEQEAGDCCADNAQNNIQEDTSIGLHDAGGDPSCDAADNDGREPTNACFVHTDPTLFRPASLPDPPSTPENVIRLHGHFLESLSSAAHGSCRC